jgi:hypothetical protein
MSNYGIILGIVGRRLFLGTGTYNVDEVTIDLSEDKYKELTKYHDVPVFPHRDHIDAQYYRMSVEDYREMVEDYREMVESATQSATQGYPDAIAQMIEDDLPF